MHMYNEIGLESTKNTYGYMHQLSPIGQKFIEFSVDAHLPVLDVGCAFGVTSIPCLLQGTNVIACDINQQHLDELEKRTPQSCHGLLTKKLARFPDEINFPNNSLSAILISHVLSFLKKDELILGFDRLYRWLCPGGRLFILNYTPFYNTITSFLPVYQERLKQNPTFAGEVEDVRKYSQHALVISNLPHRFLLLDKPTIKFLLDESKFTIDYLNYLGGHSSGVPQPLQLDPELLYRIYPNEDNHL